MPCHPPSRTTRSAWRRRISFPDVMDVDGRRQMLDQCNTQRAGTRTMLSERSIEFQFCCTRGLTPAYQSIHNSRQIDVHIEHRPEVRRHYRSPRVMWNPCGCGPIKQPTKLTGARYPGTAVVTPPAVRSSRGASPCGGPPRSSRQAARHLHPLRSAPRSMASNRARPRTSPDVSVRHVAARQPRTLEQLESNIRGMVGPPNLR